MSIISAPIVLVNAALVLLVRYVVCRRLGMRHASWWPIREVRTGEPVAGWKQALVVLAGALVAYMLAGCIFASALKLEGRVDLDPARLTNEVVVVPGHPADEAGLRDGDRIVEVGGQPVTGWADLPPAVRSHSGERVDVVVDRGKQRLTVQVDVAPEGRIGVEAKPLRYDVGVGEAVAFGVSQPVRVCVNLVLGLYRWITGNVEAELGGPVMIVKESRRSAERSTGDLLNLVGALDSYFGVPFAFLFAFVTRPTREPVLRDPGETTA
jgi:regulator of sigma E protease